MVQTLKKNVRKRSRAKRRNRSRGNVRSRKTLHKSVKRKQRTTLRRQRKKTYQKRRVNRTLRTKRRHNKRTNMRKTRRMNKRTHNKKDYYLVGDEYYQEGGMRGIRKRLGKKNKEEGEGEEEKALSVMEGAFGLLIVSGIFFAIVLATVPGSWGAGVVPAATQLTSFALESFAIFQSARIDKRESFDMVTAPNMVDTYIQILKNMVGPGSDETLANSENITEDELGSKVEEANESIDMIKKNMKKTQSGRPSPVTKDADKVTLFVASTEEALHNTMRQVAIVFKSGEWEQMKGTSAYTNFEAGPKNEEGAVIGWERWRTANGKDESMRTAEDVSIIENGNELAADFKAEVMKTQELPGKLSVQWEDLSDADRAAATALNWDKSTWGEHTDKTEVPWSDLNEDQHNSAEVLGYDETSWDNPDPYDIAGFFEGENVAPDGFSADLDEFTDKYMNGEGELKAIEEHTVAGAADSDLFAQLESEAAGEVIEGVVEGGAVVISGLLFRALKTSHERWINSTRKNTVWDYWDRPDDSSILFLMDGRERSGGKKRLEERMRPAFLKKMKVTWQDHYITRMNWNGFTDGGSFIMRRTMSNVAEKRFHDKMSERKEMALLFSDPNFTNLEFDFHHVYATIREYIKPLKTAEKATRRRGSRGSNFSDGGEPTELDDTGRFKGKKGNRHVLAPLKEKVIEALNSRHMEKPEVDRLKKWVELFLGGEVPRDTQPGEPQIPTATNVCDYLVGKSVHDGLNIPELVNIVLNILALARYGFLDTTDAHLDNVLPCKHLLEVMKKIDDGKLNEYSERDIESYRDEITKIVGVTLCREDVQERERIEDRLHSDLTSKDLRKHLAKKIHCLNRNIMNGFSELRRKHFESAGAASSKLNHRVFCMSDEAVLYGPKSAADLRLFHTYTDELSDESDESGGSLNNSRAPEINTALDQVSPAALPVELNSTKSGGEPFHANIRDLDYAGMYDLFATTVHNTTRQTLYDSNTQNVLIQQLMGEIKHFNAAVSGSDDISDGTEPEPDDTDKQNDISKKWGVMKELKRHFTCNFFNDTCTGNDLFTKMAGVRPDEKGMNMRHELFNLWEVLPKIQDPAEDGLKSSRLPENFRLSKILASEEGAPDAEGGGAQVYLVPPPKPTIIKDDALEDRSDTDKIDKAVKDPYEQRLTLHSDEQENLLEDIARRHLKFVEEDSELIKYMGSKLKEKSVEAFGILDQGILDQGNQEEEFIQMLKAKLGFFDPSPDRPASPPIKDLTSNEVYKELAAKLFTSYSWAHSLMCSQSDENYSITGVEGDTYFRNVEQARSSLYTNDDMLRQIFGKLDKSILIPKRDNTDNTTRVGSGKELGQSLARTVAPPIIGAAVGVGAAATAPVSGAAALTLGGLLTGASAYAVNKVDMVEEPRKKRLTEYLRSHTLLNGVRSDGNKQFALKTLSEIYLHKLIREGWIEIQGAHDDDNKEDLTLSVLLSVFGQGKPTVSLNLLSFLSHSLRVYKRATTFQASTGGKYISLAMDYVLILIMMTLTDVGRKYEGIFPKNGEEPNANCSLQSFLNRDFLKAIEPTSDYRFPEVVVWSPNEEFEPEPEPEPDPVVPEEQQPIFTNFEDKFPDLNTPGAATSPLEPPLLPPSGIREEGWRDTDEIDQIRYGDTVRIQDEHGFVTHKIFRRWRPDGNSFVTGQSNTTEELHSMDEVDMWKGARDGDDSDDS